MRFVPPEGTASRQGLKAACSLTVPFFLSVHSSSPRLFAFLRCGDCFTAPSSLRLFVQVFSALIGCLPDRSGLFVQARGIDVSLPLEIFTPRSQGLGISVADILFGSRRAVLDLTDALVWSATTVGVSLRGSLGFVLIPASPLLRSATSWERNGTE